MKEKQREKVRDYPVTSRAIRATERARKVTDALTDEETEELFREGMVRIYGGQPKATILPLPSNLSWP